LSDTVFLPDWPGEPLLTPLGLHAIMDESADVAQHRNPRAELLGLRTFFGWPKYKVVRREQGGPLHLTLAVELRWPPGQYAKKARGLREELEQAITRKFPALARAVERGRARFDIEFAEPGTTDYATVI
jgi:hypothetical protein